MHASMNASVPAFLSKLWSMVNDDATDAVIGWTEDGKAFYIRNQSVFSMELLPVFYKHNNLASFVRQLNMYGFRKLLTPMSGSLRNDSDEMVFAHPDFVKDEPGGLDTIKRKISHKDKLKIATTGGSELLARVYGDVKLMKNKQDALDNHLDKMKRENESLWREVLVLRQKHAKQQQIVNKLIQFLISFVQPARGSSSIGLKRKHLPMLEDSLGELAAKAPRINRTFSLDDAAASLDSSHVAGPDKTLTTRAGVPQTSTTSPGGPVIHEVTDQIPTSPAQVTKPGAQTQVNLMAASNDGAETTVPEFSPLPEQLVTSPAASSSALSAVASDHQYQQQTSPQVHIQFQCEKSEKEPEPEPEPQPERAENSSTAVALPNADPAEPTPVICDSLLESIQADLDGLRGLMGSPNWRIDTSSVQNILMDPDNNSLAAGSGDPAEPAADQQMISYNPSLLDLFNQDSEDQLFPDLYGLAEEEEGLPAVEAPPTSASATSAGATKELNTPSVSGLNTPILEVMSPKFPAPATAAPAPTKLKVKRRK